IARRRSRLERPVTGSGNLLALRSIVVFILTQGWKRKKIKRGPGMYCLRLLAASSFFLLFFLKEGSYRFAARYGLSAWGTGTKTSGMVSTRSSALARMAGNWEVRRLTSS